jgi:hypothetical protein
MFVTAIFGAYIRVSSVHSKKQAVVKGRMSVKGRSDYRSSMIMGAPSLMLIKAQIDVRCATSIVTAVPV